MVDGGSLKQQRSLRRLQLLRSPCTSPLARSLAPHELARRSFLASSPLASLSRASRTRLARSLARSLARCLGCPIPRSLVGNPPHREGLEIVAFSQLVVEEHNSASSLFARPFRGAVSFETRSQAFLALPERLVGTLICPLLFRGCAWGSSLRRAFRPLADLTSNSSKGSAEQSGHLLIRL